MKLGYSLFYVENVSASMDFYEQAFGLEKGALHGDQYGEMKSGETRIGFVHHETAGSHGFSYRPLKADESPVGFEIGFVTDNVPDAYAKAIAAGAAGVSEPKTKPWGQTVSYVRDCNGVLVEICSPMGS